ncbi:NUC169 domain-containing protein [Gongronella butleri]|nr:NUC169 domain-containing protein [Gongronella butleri]
MESDDELSESEQDADSDDNPAEFPELTANSEEESDEEGSVDEEDSDEEINDYLAGDSLDEADLDEDDDELLKSNPYKRDAHGHIDILPEIEANYDSDSSTEEIENTVGKIPMEWYDDLPHIGYDIDGKKILKPATGDELDKFLDTIEDPDSWKSAYSAKDGKSIVLNDDELDIIQRLQEGQIPDAGYNPYEPTVEFFTSKTETMPLSARPEPKRRFIPSKWEAKKIMKIVHAIRLGRIVPRKPKKEKAQFYNLWTDDTPKEEHVMHIAAPKMKLPEHDESYNPPEEYLPDEKETQEWLDQEPRDRSKNYLPKKFKSLRQVPAYGEFIQERFQRCLDLYLAPRVKKNRLNIDPESLVPKLPSPKDLRPFPTTTSLSYDGHSGRIRSLSVHPDGLLMISGGDDGTVRLWEVTTARCLFTWQLHQTIHAVAWNPNPNVYLFAVSVGDGLVLLIVPPCLRSEDQAMAADQFACDGFAHAIQDEEKNAMVWSKPTSEEATKYGFKVRLQHKQSVKQIVWHRKGDYFATVCPDAGSVPLLIHQTTRHQSQTPFRRLKGTVQKVIFHPVKPTFFVATQRFVRVYDLMQQQLIKTLAPGVRWISSIDVHPGGDNVIIGSYDKRVCWFDMDLSSQPYKSLRFHGKAVRQVTYHKRYPLFASASDDGSIQVFHGMVYNDLLQNPLIVPVKILRGHQIQDNLGVLDIMFHPTQPWIFSSGADGSIRLWT